MAWNNFKGGRFQGFSYLRERDGKKGKYDRALVRVGRMFYRVALWDGCHEGAVSWRTRAGRFYFPLRLQKAQKSDAMWGRVQAGGMRVSVIVKDTDKGRGVRVVVKSRSSYNRRPSWVGSARYSCSGGGWSRPWKSRYRNYRSRF